MIHDLKPYPAYTDSGVAWLGELPEHWEVTRLKDAAVVQTGLTLGKSYQGEATESRPYLRVANVQHGRLDLSEVKCLDVPPREAAGSTLRAGDVLMTEGGDIDKLGRGCVWRGEIPGCLHQNHVFAVRCRPRSLVPQFLALLMVSRHGRAYFELTAKQTTNLASTNSTTLRAFPVLLPPLAEQAAIVHFLGHMDRRIRRYIRSKQRLIALLHEQRQAIIHRAVTRGLDPNVRLKPSGVEWLGDVPEHWEVVPLRRVTVARCDGPFGSSLKSSHYTEQGIRVVRLQNIGHGEFRNSDAVFVSSAHYASLGDHSVEAGDVLIAGLGDERHPAGRACIAPTSITPAMVKADCFRFRLDPGRVNSEFVALHLTATAVAASAILSTGATRQRTNLQSTAARAVCIPPLHEQDPIVASIYNDMALLNVAVSGAQSEISLLREYRTRLISDVVTGKLDVREAAARLPDEAQDPEPLDDGDVLAADDGGSTEAAYPDATLEGAEA